MQFEVAVTYATVGHAHRPNVSFGCVASQPGGGGRSGLSKSVGKEIAFDHDKQRTVPTLMLLAAYSARTRGAVPTGPEVPFQRDPRCRSNGTRGGEARSVPSLALLLDVEHAT